MMNWKALAEWALSGDVGASSKFMAAHLCDFKSNGWKSHPCDGGDFERCEGLLKAVPELRSRLHEMTAASPYWAALVPHWEQIAIMDRPHRYKKIKELTDPIEKKDRSMIRISPSMSVRFSK
jgi:hypothetical protein